MTRISRRSLVALAVVPAFSACFSMAELGPYEANTGSPSTAEAVARAFQLEGLAFAPVPVAKYTQSQIADVFIADDAAYCLTTNDTVYTISLGDGTPRWSLKLDHTPDHGRGFAWGLDRVGFVSNNRIDVVTKEFGSRILTANLQFTPSTAGILTADSFFAGSWGNGYSLRSATLVDGWAGWRHAVDDAITAKPVLLGPGSADTAIVFAAHDGRVVSIEPRPASGSPPAANWIIKTTGKNTADLATDGQVIYVASEDSVLYAVSKGAGAIKWKWFGANEPLHRGPSVANGIVYQPVARGVVAIDAATGAELGTVAGARRYLTRIGDRDYFEMPDRTVMTVDTTNGNVVQTVHSPLFTMVVPNPTGSALVFCDGKSLFAVR
jgi:PQQ-like domain